MPLPHFFDNFFRGCGQVPRLVASRASTAVMLGNPVIRQISSTP
jgi:hypothetical protein